MRSPRAWPALLAVALVGVTAPAARAADWSEVFAGEPDTVLFIGAGTQLWKGPFHLAARETLWTPSAGERVARIRVSPDRRRIAWITRAQDFDTTKLWIYVDGAPRLGARYFSFQPSLRGAPNFEPVVPTVQDEVVDGARLVAPNPTMLRRSSNALAWTPEGGAVVFGYDGGLATLAADTAAALEVSPVNVTDVLLLDPAPFYLADVTVAPPTSESGTGVSRPRFEIGAYLLYPTPDRWRFFRTSGLGFRSLRSVDHATLWWAAGRELRAARAYDPTPTVEAREGGDIVWLEAQPERRAIAWAAGRRLVRKPAEGGAEEVVLETRQPITQVLGGPRGRWRAAVTADSLHLWDRLDGARAALALGGVRPIALFEGPAGELAVVGAGRAGPDLYRVDREGQRLVDGKAPDVKGGRFWTSPSGGRLILANSGAAPPRRMQVYDLASGRWAEVVNPGIAGWERLGP